MSTSKSKPNWTRTTITLLITLCIIYFAIGALVAWFGGMTWQAYLNAGGLVGGVASVLGLLSLARPALDQSDIARIDGESLKKLAENSEKIKELEAQRTAKLVEIDTLAERQRTLELFVQKAALSLFLKERLRYTEKKVVDRVKNDDLLLADLRMIGEVASQLEALDEEIETDQNVNLLRTVIASAYEVEPQPQPRPIDPVLIVVELIEQALRQVLSVWGDIWRSIVHRR